MSTYVYVYIDPVRNEPIYVGRGTGRRAKSHLGRTDHHPLTHRIAWIRKQGLEPSIIFLCKEVDSEFASLVEMEAISKYGRRDLGTGSLLNLTDGGEGGITNASADVRLKISKAVKGRKLPPRSQIARNNISKAAKLRDDTKRVLATKEANQKRCKACTVDGIKIYPSKKALIADLGQGKDGVKSPTFRFV